MWRAWERVESDRLKRLIIDALPAEVWQSKAEPPDDAKMLLNAPCGAASYGQSTTVTDGHPDRDPSPPIHPSTHPQEISAAPPLVSVPSALDLAFDEFWTRYPHKIDKQPAKARYKAARKSHDAEVILAGLDAWCRYWLADGTEQRHVPYPTKWLSAERFLAQPPRARGALRPTTVSQNGAVMAPGVES
jgi:hypothetical protein